MTRINNHKKLAFLSFGLFLLISLGYLYFARYYNNQPPFILGKQPIWIFDAGDQIASCLSDKNLGVFVSTSNASYLVNGKTGVLLWKTNLGEGSDAGKKYSIQTGAKSNGTEIFIQKAGGEVLSFDMKDGKLLWKSKSSTESPVFDMTANQNSVYVSRLSSSLVALDASTGVEIWSNPVPDRTALFVFSTDEKVYLGTGYKLFVYDSHTGDLLLEYQLDGLMERMFIDSDNIYITYLDEKYSVVSLNTKTLEHKWSISGDTLLLSEVNSMLVDDNVVYITGSKLVSLSGINGNVLWISDVEDSFGKPIIQDDLLIVQGKTLIYVFNKNNGKVLSKQRIPGGFPLSSWISYSQANPCGTDKMIWLAGSEKLYAYDLSN